MTDKPFAVTVSPRAQRISPEQAELFGEILEADADIQRIQARQPRPDAIGEFLGCTYHVQQWSFPYVRYKDGPLTVSRYYPQKRVAVDIFKQIDKAEAEDIAFKRVNFKKYGIRYGALSYQSELSELMPQVGFK